MNRLSRVLIDARYVTGNLSGIERYTLNLLHGLGSLGAEVSVLIPPGVAALEELGAYGSLRLIEAGGNPRRLADQWRIQPLVRRLRPALVHSLDAFAPLGAPCRTLITLYDLIPLQFRHLLPASRKARAWPLWRAWLHVQCRCARGVLTISRYSAEAIRRVLHVPAPHLATPGIAPPPPPDPAVDAAALKRVGLPPGHPYILYTGRMEPYKGVDRLVEAFDLARRRLPAPLHLLLVGEEDPRHPQAHAAVARLGLDDAVTFAGYAPDDELAALYRQASLFVFPSLCEGFGLPPLEAMSHGTPVIASNRTALPEAVGDAGLLVDPDDTAALADAIVRVLTDRALADRLADAGRRRAAEHTPERQAAMTLDVYRKLLG